MFTEFRTFQGQNKSAAEAMHVELQPSTLSAVRLIAVFTKYAPFLILSLP